MPRAYTKSEARRRREKLRILAGVADFFGTVMGFVLILACVVMITTLIAWFRTDISDVFSSLLGPLINALEAV